MDKVRDNPILVKVMSELYLAGTFSELAQTSIRCQRQTVISFGGEGSDFTVASQNMLLAINGK